MSYLSDNSRLEREICIPKPAVQFDNSANDFKSFQSYLQESEAVSASNNAVHHSSRLGVSAGDLQTPNSVRSNVPLQFISPPTAAAMSSTAGIQEMISSLEEEFDALNQQYRRLLSTVSASSMDAPDTITEESMENRAKEIVEVIQKLHEKGEQLRILKSPPR